MLASHREQIRDLGSRNVNECIQHVSAGLLSITQLNILEYYNASFPVDLESILMRLMSLWMNRPSTPKNEG